FFSSRRRHTRFSRDWSSDVCSSDLLVCAWSVGRSGRTCVSNTDLLSGDVEPQAASSATSDSGEQAPQSNGAGTTPKRRPGGLSGMVIAELRELAAELGITGTTGMRKGDLIAAIRERQGKTKRTRTTAKSSGS